MFMYQIDAASLSPAERDALEQRLNVETWEVYTDRYRHTFKIQVEHPLDPRKAFSIPDSCPVRQL